MSTVPLRPRPPAWAVLALALGEQRPVRARYHGADRLLCPHTLGWKDGRAKLLAYQAEGSTSHGQLSAEPQQRWRSMFVDEIEDAVLTDEPWHTADNYTLSRNGMDRVELALLP